MRSGSFLLISLAFHGAALAVVWGMGVGASGTAPEATVAMAPVAPAPELRDEPEEELPPIELPEPPDAEAREEEVEPEDAIIPWIVDDSLPSPRPGIIGLGGMTRIPRGRIPSRRPAAPPAPVVVAPPPPPPPVYVPPPPPSMIEARAVAAPVPTYPESARQRSIEGVVRLEVEVLEDGGVGEIRIVESSGAAVLDRAAIAAVRKWVFEPARINGEAVRSVVSLRPFRFQLRDER